MATATITTTATATATATTTIAEPEPVTLDKLKRAIPKHCFVPSTFRSASHVVVDVTLSAIVAAIAHTTIPLLDSWYLRTAAWLTYGYVQGLLFTGIWIIAHECGHEALFPSKQVNDAAGLVLHSALGVPYFSWKITHARHHRYANHMEKDTVFVPYQEGESTLTSKISKLIGAAEDFAEDAPLYNLLALALHQLLGWQTYILSYASAGIKSTPAALSKSSPLLDSHLNPASGIWTNSQRKLIFLSILGLTATGTALYIAAQYTSASHVFLLYGQPYLWVNNWIVAITYLHHTHPQVPHYTPDRWTYTDGALSTIDRPFGFVGKYLFHNILDYHVVHHLFSKIPFYHAEEATQAIRPILGDRYVRDETPFWLALWKTWGSCEVVGERKGEKGVLDWIGKEKENVKGGRTVGEMKTR